VFLAFAQYGSVCLLTLFGSCVRDGSFSGIRFHSYGTGIWDGSGLVRSGGLGWAGNGIEIVDRMMALAPSFCDVLRFAFRLG
jgi:hypothetical protein